MRNEKTVEGRNENFQLLGKRPRNKSAAHTICSVSLPGAYPLRPPGRNPRLWTALQYLLGRSHNRWMQTQKPARMVICPRITLALGLRYCLLGWPWRFPFTCMHLALLLDCTDFPFQLPDENLHWEHHLSSNSALQSSTNFTPKLLLLTPCFSSWPGLQKNNHLWWLIFFLFHRIQLITKLMQLPSLIHHLHIRTTILVWTLIFFFRNDYW